ncbi:MAG TPA: TIGR03118 family protein, partial [Chthoniobacterales bacterium]|nr:TIGR03118 family protein [Chthoniobacterales bacterium]
SINYLLYITFAAQNVKKHDDVSGTGAGFVDVFDAEGNFIKRLITGGNLNSPWGLAKVPDHEHFGNFDGEVLLVGNFGDGFINAFNSNSGTQIGTTPLLHRNGQPLQFDDLWALVFFQDKLYFTAGIVDEMHGLFGFIHPQENENSND